MIKHRSEQHVASQLSYMCRCVYVLVYAICMHVCKVVRACIYIYIYTYMYKIVGACICICVNLHMRVCVCVNYVCGWM